MDLEWFRPLLEQALGTLAAGATPAQRDELLHRLLQLSRANGGEVVGDFPESLARPRAVTAAEDAITAYLRASGVAPDPRVGLAGLVARAMSGAPHPGETPLAPLTRLARELERAVAWVRAHPFARYRGRPLESARRANEQATQEAQSRWRLARAYDDVEGAALVRNGTYLPLATDIIESARSSIRVVMFRFHHVPEDEADPTRPLVAGLVAAHGRGVEVRILLDQSGTSARLAGQPACAALAAAGIAVRWGDPARIIDTSLMVVDRRQVLLGSHVWTPESLGVQDETSVYVESRALGQHYFDVFGGRFEAAYG